MPEARAISPRILFRADGDARIGSGHLRRCLALAEQLRDWQYECLFVCAGAERSFNYLVHEAGFDLVELPARAADAAMDGAACRLDAEDTMAAVASRGPFAVAIVDHYGLDRIWHRQIRAIASRIAVIDDLADRPHECDVLVDVLPGDPTRYDALVPPSCRKLLGARYALLRPEFARLRRQDIERSGTVDRVLISFGGVDRDNLTSRAIEAVRAVLPEAAIDATVPRSSPDREALQMLASTDTRLSVHLDAANMAELMAAAHLAVGAGGSTSWERACLGLPSVVAVIADNQRATVDALEASGCAVAISAGPDFRAQLERFVACLSASPGLLHLMSDAGAATVDGRGVARVAGALCSPDLTVRPAGPDDARGVWEWRNAPEIRATAVRSDEIPWEAHLSWFSSRIADPSTVMLIGEERGAAIGVVRFDIEGAEATVSIFLVPGQAGRGRGIALLQAGQAWIESRHPCVERFLAEVRAENSESISLFKGANYNLRLLNFERTAND